MGWLAHHTDNIEQRIREDLCGDENDPRVLRIEFGPGRDGQRVAYVALRPDRAPERVMAVIALIEGHDGGNVAIKYMDEDMGPHYWGASRKFLKLLTPAASRWAAEWRQECRRYGNHTHAHA